MNAKELSQALAQRATAVAEYLLPGGKKKGQEWKAGSVSGDAGDSLGVHLTGTKAGVWRDFAADVGGDLLDLWMAARGCSLPQAITEAKAFCGVTDVRLESAKTWKRPPQKTPVAKPESAAVRWLKSERLISDAAIHAYQVGSSSDGQSAVFPHMRDGEMVNFKLRHCVDKKRMMTFGGGEPCLWGWQAIPQDARSVVITEGEIDAMTVWQYGFPALSVFSGVANLGWIESDHDRLERFSDIVLCMDMDDAGQAAARKIAERLGIERCRIATLPKKDANDCLKAGIAAADVAKAIEGARYLDPDELRKAPDFLEGVIEHFYPSSDGPIGAMFPWLKTAGKLAIRPAELSIWTGLSGHGKSQLLGQVILHAAVQGERICVASMEIKPESLLSRMVRQMAAEAEPRIPVIKQCMEWLNGKMWVFNSVGTVTTDRVLEVFVYARKRYGITQFVIDSLMKCGIDEDDYVAQKAFVDRLCDFKNAHNVHVHLVAHSRKKMNEHEAPGKMDVKGTGAITDLADNVYSVWRNKKKEAGEENAPAMDAVLACDKQRHGDWEGSVALWFDRASFQYLEDEHTQARRMDFLIHHAPTGQEEDSYVDF